MPNEPSIRRFFASEETQATGILPSMVRAFHEAEKRGAAYGVPKIPPIPKPPSLGSSNLTGAKPSSNFRGVPPLARAPQAHKPVAELSSMSAARSSDAAAKGPSEKLNAPSGPKGP